VLLRADKQFRSQGEMVWLALSCLLFGIGVAWLGVETGTPMNGPFSLGVFLVACQSLPLVAAPRTPLVPFVTVVVAATVYGVLSYPGSPIEFGELAAIYFLASSRPTREAVLAGGACISGIVIVATTSPSWRGGALTVVAVAMLFAAVAAGGAVHRLRQIGLREATERVVEVEQTRAERDALAAMEERLRLAEELHDMVGHTLAVVLLHAGLARRALDDDPDRSRRALAVIEDRASIAMQEMQRLLGVLVDESNGVAALPTIADVDRLAAEVRSAGIDVVLQVDPTIGELPVALDLTAYRIVQEALTNTVRHAHAERAWVTIGQDNDRLRISASDDGRGWAPGSHRREGRGLIGMRERVARLGGDLTIGSRPQGGVQVCASLPLTTTETAATTAWRSRTP
jgi:signal transduction histidine kinase